MKNVNKSWRRQAVANDPEQQEFFHIRKMVVELEQLIQNGDDVSLELPVMQPEYWRNRINSLLATPAISGSTVAQVSLPGQSI